MRSSSDRPPADEDARERIASMLNATLFVEAGAGTGKTTALVMRMCALVASGVPIGSLAAITFTEAAAAELRDRVRAELECRIANNDPASPAFAAALAGIDAAAIQTLHGFARRILALYPLEAGLPPRFDVRDQVEADAVFEDRWAVFLAELFSDIGSGPRLPRALTLGLTAARLRTIASALHNNFDRLSPMAAVSEPPVAIDVTAILEALTEALELRSQCTDPADKLLLHLNTLVPPERQLRDLAHTFDTADEPATRTIAGQDVLAALNEARLTPSGNAGRTGSWGPKGRSQKDQVVQCLKAAEAARQSLLDDVRRDCIEFVLPALVGWALESAEVRRSEGTLEYHDLLVLAVRLLRMSTPVRYTLHRRFTHLLIDEFQDTDPLQIELAALLTTTAEEVDDTEWQDLPVRTGSLFFVGDPRQSIYRFRRAEIELYEAARAAFASVPVSLTANFRSKRGIVTWANELFAHIFDQPYGDTPETPRQAGYTPLVAHIQEDAPVVRVIGGPMEGRNGAIRAAEAAEIATLIRSACDNNWLRKVRPDKCARFADVTILIPDRNALPPLERALDSAAIPFRVEGSTLLFGTQEVRDFTNILAAIDDPADEVAVVAALRSPAFACGDDELYAFKQLRKRRTWDYTGRLNDSDVPADNRVRQAMETLRGFYEQRSWLSVAELVETIIRERRLLELAFANSRPRDTWQRIRFLHEHARRFDDSPAGTLRHFVAWLQTSAKSGAQFTESVVPDPDDKAVRIMTIHAAKGLEFPIVFVAGLLPKPRAVRGSLLFGRRHGGGAQQPEVSVGRVGAYFRTAGYAALDVREKVMDRLERDRLLYVAATRARECLVVSAYHAASSTSSSTHQQRHLEAKCSLAECIYAACEQLPSLRGAPPPAASPMPLEFAPPEGEPPDLAVRQRWIEDRAELIARNNRPETLAATAIAHAAESIPEKPEPRDDDQSPWRRGRAGTAVGRAVHAVLQTVDLATLEGVEDAARAQAAAEGVPDREAEIVGLVRSAAESGPVRLAVASGRFWRELYVATPIPTDEGSMLLEGFVDLLYQSDDGFVVVDYKTDAVRTEDEADTAMSRYRLQGAAYGLALQERLPTRVVRFDCVFVRQNGPARVRSIDGAELVSAMAEVRARIASNQRDEVAVVAS